MLKDEINKLLLSVENDKEKAVNTITLPLFLVDTMFLLLKDVEEIAKFYGKSYRNKYCSKIYRDRLHCSMKSYTTDLTRTFDEDMLDSLFSNYDTFHYEFTADTRERLKLSLLSYLRSSDIKADTTVLLELSSLALISMMSQVCSYVFSVIHRGKEHHQLSACVRWSAQLLSAHHKNFVNEDKTVLFHENREIQLLVIAFLRQVLNYKYL